MGKAPSLNDLNSVFRTWSNLRWFYLKSSCSQLFFFFFFNYYFISTTSIDIHCSSTYSNIKITKKSYKIFDFKSRDSTFYKAIEKRGHVSSMQLICMTKQKNKYCHKNRKVRDCSQLQVSRRSISFALQCFENKKKNDEFNLEIDRYNRCNFNRKE